MDWLSHILYGLLFSSEFVRTSALVLGSFVPDVFFFTNSIIYFRHKRGALGKRLLQAYDYLGRGTKLQAIGEAIHSIPFFALLIIAAFIYNNIWFWSFTLGCTVHFTLDLFTHKDDKYPLLFPFSKRRYHRGFWNWRINDVRLLIINFIILGILYAIKYIVNL